MKEDLRARLLQLEQELKNLSDPEKLTEEERRWLEEDDDEEEDPLGPGYNWAVDFHRAVYADEEPVPEEALVSRRRGRKEKTQKKTGRRQVILALLEILAIAAVLGWWLR